MLKSIFKSKQGFTLIELLVVIGILAVLAAIAIPSVAGLIDRANVSADATNANEMTNAMERFVSEYELYCQDIASGRIDFDNLDAAQGRVFNVTGATTRAEIEALEANGNGNKIINRDTKYPANLATTQAVVENYMKTSSTTFMPKQSDCHYYYSPDCGLVVCTETDKAEVADLNALVQNGKDAKGQELTDDTHWVHLTEATYAREGKTLIGDVNNDGFINGKDYAVLLQYIDTNTVEDLTYFDIDAADTNQDGEINNLDYTRLIRYINGWEDDNIGKWK